jgi:hypothetical protein
MKRHKMGKKHSKKSFSRGADRVHKKNFSSSAAAPFIMRGGTRL